MKWEARETMRLAAIVGATTLVAWWGTRPGGAAVPRAAGTGEAFRRAAALVDAGLGAEAGRAFREAAREEWERGALGVRSAATLVAYGDRRARRRARTVLDAEWDRRRAAFARGARDPPSLRRLGTLAILTGRGAAAAEMLLSAGTSPESGVPAARCFAAAGRPDRARAVLAGVDLRGAPPETIRDAARLHLVLGAPRRALALLEGEVGPTASRLRLEAWRCRAARTEGPARTALLARLDAAAGEVLARRPRDETARAVRWAVTLERSAGLPRPDPRVLVLLGVIAAREGRLRDARRWNEAALRASPDEPAALNNLAWVLARSGEAADRAVDLARRAVAGDPANPEYRDTLETALAADAR